MKLNSGTSRDSKDKNRKAERVEKGFLCYITRGIRLTKKSCLGKRDINFS